MANGDNNLNPDPSNYDPKNQAAFNKFAKENAKVTAEITDQARSLTEELKDQLGIRSRLNEGQRSTVNLAKQLTASAQQNTIEIGNSGNIQRQIAKDQKLALAIEREKAGILRDGNEDALKKATAIFSKTEELQKIQDQIAESGLKASEAQKSKIANLEKELTKANKVATSDERRLSVILGMEDVSKRMASIREAESRTQDRITDRMGVTGALVKGTGALMERLGMRSGIFQKAMTQSAEAMRDMAEQTERGEASFSKTQIMLKGFSVLSKGFGQALFDPFTIATGILDAFLKINKAQVEVSRLTGQLGTNFSRANGAASLDGAATAIDRLEIMAELTESIGMNAQNIFSAANIQGAANLKLELGLSAAAAGSLAMQAQATGTNVSDLTDNIIASTSEFNAQNRSAVSQGQILRDIGNTSDDIKLSLGGSTDELVSAASSARRLGMDLKQVDSIAGSLLDFESSIEKELEAQLLTGKQMNLAKARELALSNDLDGLGKELLKNSSDITEFGNMNRIQQEAQAAALGMTRQELGRVAYLRGLELGMTEDQASAAADVTAEDMKRISAQENFTKAIEKITTALSPILNIVGDILSMPIAPYLLFGAIAAKKLGGNILGAVQGIGKLTGGVQGISGGFKSAMKAAGGFGNLIKNKLMGNKIGGQFLQGGGRAAKGARAGMFGKGGMFEKVGGAFKKGKAEGLTKSIKASADNTSGIKPESGTGIKGFLKGLGDGLASVGRQMSDVLKGALAIGVAGLALGGSFALALRMVKDVDPMQMIAFAGSIGILGLSLALLGKIGSSVIQGALAMGILSVALIPAAFAFSLLAGVSAGAMFAFAGALTLLGVAAAGLGFLFPFIVAGAAALGVLGLALIPAAAAFGMIQGLDMDVILSFAQGVAVLAKTAAGLGLIAPFIFAGSAAIAALGLALVPLSYGFNMLGSTPIEAILGKLQGLASMAPQLALVGFALMSIAAGLGMVAVAGIAALPVMAGLGVLALTAAPLLALGGLFGGEDSEDNSMAEISSKLDLLINAVNSGGNVYLDGNKVGEAQVIGTYKLS